jgi:uncharacterized alpha-E superfamily protein
VLASEPERQLTLRVVDDHPTGVTRGEDGIPARVADNLFWLGRYASRTENCARVLREVVLRVVASERAAVDDGVALLVNAVTRPTPAAHGGDAVAPTAPTESDLLAALTDGSQTGSLRFDLDALIRTGSAVRDRLSTDASRVIHALDRALVTPLDLTRALQAVQRIILHLSAFTGFCHESMTRGPGWCFLEIGRRLEHAMQLSALVRPLAGAGLPSHRRQPWEVLLAAVQSLKTFRRRYRSRLQPSAVLDLVLFDPGNPRSLAFQLARLAPLVESLSGDAEGRRSAESRLALDALMRLRLFDADRPGTPGEPSGTAGLDALLLDINLVLAQLSDEITQRYFHLTDVPQQLWPLQQ